MPNKVTVHKNRTNRVVVNLGMDVSADTFASEVRASDDVNSTLIMTWTIDATDAADGILVLTVDDSVTSEIEVDSGFMDIKRVSAGEPLPVWDRPLEVVFRGSVTA